MTVGSCGERNWTREEGCGDEEDSGWDCGRGPSGYSGGIDRRGIGSDNAQDDDKSDRLGGIAGGWTGEGPENVLRSTRTLLVVKHVLRQIRGGRTRPRYWRRRCGWIGQ